MVLLSLQDQVSGVSSLRIDLIFMNIEKQIKNVEITNVHIYN